MQVLSFGNEAAKGPVTIFLHGFPGVKSKQNREIAENVARMTGRRVLVLPYSGLGHAEGVFSFKTCLEEVRAWFKQQFALHPNKRFYLVGHSWGGFLSLRMTSEFPDQIDRLVLMSPLLGFADEELAAPVFQDTSLNNPNLKLADIPVLARSFALIGETYSVAKTVASIPERIDIIILQAKNDDVTPTPIAEKMLSKFKRRPEFHLVEQDHSFLVDRAELAKNISAFLVR